MFVILADSLTAFKNDDYFKKYVNIVFKPLSPLLFKPYSNACEIDGKSTKNLELPLKSSHFGNMAKSSSVIESENEGTSKKECSEEGQKQIKK